jgi:hypothetical protein
MRGWVLYFVIVAGVLTSHIALDSFSRMFTFLTSFF